MAVYEQTYKPYKGKLTPEWNRFLIIPRHTLRGVFNSKLFTAFYVICFLPLLGRSGTDLLAPQRHCPGDHESQREGVDTDRRFVLSVLRQHPGRLCVLCGVTGWTTTRFARSAKQRAAAVSLPSVYTDGVRDGQDVGVDYPFVVDHVGTAVVDVSLSVVPGRLRVVSQQSVDREWDRYWRPCVDPAAGTAFANGLSAVEMAHRCEWGDAGTGVYSVGVRRHC